VAEIAVTQFDVALDVTASPVVRGYVERDNPGAADAERVDFACDRTVMALRLTMALSTVATCWTTPHTILKADRRRWDG
jgi:hypothetical protein